MKILAIESSGSVASAAILEDKNVIIEKLGPFKVTHSETLMPLISECFNETGLKPEDMDLIAVSGGPGSFTGLRIGSATAKGLGFALDKTLVHVPTLDAMAMNQRESGKLIIPLMDARRSQVYTGIYEFEGGQLVTLHEGCAMSIQELVRLVNEKYASREIVFLGDGVETSLAVLNSECKASFTLAVGTDALQRAASVGVLGCMLAQEGKTVSAADEAPEYLRPSQAERVRAEQEGR